MSVESLSHSLSSIKPSQQIDHIHYRPFIATNENGQSATLDKLKRHAVNQGNAVIGVSGYFTLNVASVLPNVDYIFVTDVGARVQDFWEQIGPVIVGGASREEVLQKTQALLKDRCQVYYQGADEFQATPQGMGINMAVNLQEEVEQGDSWLSDDTRFAKIQEIFQKNHFFFLPYDLTDARPFAQLAEVLEEHDITPAAVYTSNVPEYLQDDQIQQMADALEPLIGPETLVVQTKPRACKSCEQLTQCVRRRHASPVVDLFKPVSSQGHACKKATMITISLEELMALLQSGKFSMQQQ